MSEPEKFYPIVEHLGKECSFWGLDQGEPACGYPKSELEGRTTCRGIVDDVCLYIIDGRPPSELSDMLLKGIRTRQPDSSLLPPGDVSKS